MVNLLGLIIEKRPTDVIVITAEATNTSFSKEYEHPYKPGNTQLNLLEPNKRCL